MVHTRALRGFVGTRIDRVGERTERFGEARGLCLEMGAGAVDAGEPLGLPAHLLDLVEAGGAHQRLVDDHAEQPPLMGEDHALATTRLGIDFQ